MRWQARAPSPNADLPWWGWLLFPIWAPVIALFAAAFGAVWCKRWLIGPTEEWRPWFAWFPIAFETWPDHEDWPVKERVWMEWVERRAGHLLGDAEHRMPDQPGPTPPSTIPEGGEE